MERTVGRSELQSEDSFSSSSADLEAVQRLKQMKDFEIVHALTNIEELGNRDENTVDTPDDSEYDFRLFGTTNAVKREQPLHSIHKIRLSSPPTSKAKAGFTQPTRDSTYYFTQPVSTLEKRNIESVALTGEEVLAHARRPWPGSSYSWKVLHLPITNVQKSIRTQHLYSFQKLVNDNPPIKRSRHGKKYRIKLRNRHATLQAQKDANKAAAEKKAAAEREKRTRRNREKKVKKRLRDKSKIASVPATANLAAQSSAEQTSPEVLAG